MVDKYIIVKKDKVESNISDFEYSWEYISESGKNSPTYLFLEDAEFYSGNLPPIKRNFQKHERQKSGLVIARLAIQVFEEKLDRLSEQERRNLVTDATGNRIGLWNNVEDLTVEWGNSSNKGIKPSREYVADKFIGNVYPSTADKKFFFYNAGLYDSLFLAQSFLNEFGADDDYFKVYVSQNDAIAAGVDTDPDLKVDTYIESHAKRLISSKNIIYRGAPGTGKSYLAKEIAAFIVSEGRTTNQLSLTKQELQQIEFVQFHPSYDYTDFVEGLRPISKDNQIGFKLTDGIFKSFCKRATQATNGKISLEGFRKYLRTLGNNEEQNYFYIIEQLLGLKEYSGNKIDDFPVYDSLMSIYNDADRIKEIDKRHGFRQWLITPMNYLQKYVESETSLHKETKRKYVFIIDEINRGEISKIFGELFFSIDPGYRGVVGSVKTQYSSLHGDSSEFYIPENVYIIGTMNDIDRSVDSFDFAMRRRFRFINISANESTRILERALGNDGEQLLSENVIEESISRMTIINDLISSDEFPELNSNYHIGASYFLKIAELNGNFSYLWNDYLEPLFREYLRGTYDEESQIERIRNVYESLSLTQLERI
ncbi:McrB family protein [Erysipelothrix anatis]|uniref:McrB family protein n=1 Tax=Erysipelothrix anatis TaxID=2683713 RepID=UPI0019163A1F|nr:AAA family ATPase [Erysipelothrix anatis]